MAKNRIPSFIFRTNDFRSKVEESLCVLDFEEGRVECRVENVYVLKSVRSRSRRVLEVMVGLAIYDRL